MNRATPRIRDFAGRLITHELKSSSRIVVSKIPAAFRVCEKLRVPLATLLGHAGFRALLSRALALAAEEVPWLRGAQVRSDGTFEGLDQLQAQVDARRFVRDSALLPAQLLGLLVAFIGDKLTLQLVRETWPKLPPTPWDRGQGKSK